MIKIKLIYLIPLALIFFFPNFYARAEGLVNINTADIVELESLHGIGPVKAQAIVDYRETNGLFVYLDEIKNVNGVGESTFNDIKDSITTGAKFVSGSIGGNEVWFSEPGEFYALNGDVIIPAGLSLVVEAGTSISYDRGPFRKIVVQGEIFLNGENSSTITLNRVGVEVGEGANFSASYAEFSGPGSYGIYQTAGSVEVENSKFSSFNHGVLATGGTLYLESNTFESNSEYALNVSGDTLINLVENTFSNNNKTAYVSAGVNLNHTGNTAVGSGEKGFERSGHARDGAVWHSDDLPLIISSLIVDASTTLTLSPGAALKMKSGSYIDVRGTLVAQGSAFAPVSITSFKDDSVVGDTNGDESSSLPGATDWNGLAFYSGSSGDLAYVSIKYAGGYAGLGQGSGRAGLFNLGGNVTFDNITFSQNFSADIYQNAGSLTGTKGDFGSLQTGFVFVGGTANVSQSRFYSSTNSIENNSSDNVLDARNNWWGSESGPTISANPDGMGGRVYGNVLYEPWLDSDPFIPPPRNPVIIVPGIMGSKLVGENGEEIWMSLIRMALSIDDGHLLDLQIDNNGSSIFNITASDIIAEVNIPLFSRDTFSSLINTLINIDYQSNIDLFTFPYDWRLGINISSEFLNNKITEIKQQTGSEKVDIIAHSMGGLLLKKYLSTHGGLSIGKFIDIGTPHFGAPKSFITLMYGDVDISILNKNTLKQISQNIPSIYQLLPSRNYFYEDSNDYRYYIFDSIGRGRLKFEDSFNYMISNGRNNLLLERADELHQELDGLDPADYGVETYNIVSCGVPTLGQIFVLEEKSPGKFKYNLRMIDGDGTVPLRSAEAIAASSTYYFRNIKHALMPSASGVKELIADLLAGEEVDLGISKTAEVCGLPNGSMVSFHSPIELHIYDEFGNHAGPNEDGDIINEIDGVVYEVVDDNKFAFLPAGYEYTVKGQATDSGSFDVMVQEIVGGGVATTTVFSNLPLTQSTQTQFLVGSTTPSKISLDQDGDGIYDAVHQVSSVVLGMIESVVPTFILDTPTQVSGSSGSSRVIIEKILAVDESVALPAETLVQSEPAVALNIQEVQASEGVIEESEELPIITSESPERNLATAYQAVKEYLKELFTRIWQWFISKI